ncbi:probable polyamine transporter At3g19553 isoform X4 [Ziziphus jujuba]|uniref:Probable polyamine transporter At3g19553 isoform X4 n=1 Tax=Ziziphus jujuba TaxID=326968 RepID=A0A6P4A9P7_ZIZJJ|nr:probable polyamine transporter At3g19553 isoform X4 [Ziziphus jujuba]
MGEEEGMVSDVKSSASEKTNPKLTLLPLIALIFYEVSGGPFGVEDSVRAGGGPLLSLLGFLVFPFIWSIPEALVTAELATCFPENGGIRPMRWLVVDFKKVDWRGYFNSMFWNLNYWDKASTLAGEVENPSKTFPKALFGAVVVVVSSYLIPILAGTGALRSGSGEWTDGYFAEVGMLIGGFWLKWWIQAAAAMSNMGLFEAEMSSDAFQLLGMSEMGMLPSIFASRSKHGTPTISILCSATGVIFLSWMSFQEILEFLNFLYAIGMLLEFAAFVVLRIKKPDLDRPYKVPFQTFGATMLCLPPALLLVLVMSLATMRTFFVSGAVIILGFLLYPLLVHAKERKWALFDASKPAMPPNISLEDHSVALQPRVTDEASVSLLSELSSLKTEQEPSQIMEGVLKVD